MKNQTSKLDLKHTKQNNRQIRYCDLLIVGMFIIVLGVRFTTTAIFASLEDFSGVEIEKTVKIYETNPIMKIVLNAKGVHFIASTLMIPACMIATYLYFRRRVRQGKMDVDSFIFFCQFAFLLMAVNLLNDSANLLGILVK